MATKTRTVCFYALGPDFTRTVRDLWQDDKPHLALHCLMDGNPDVPLEIVLGILTGTHMLAGDSRDKKGMSITTDPSDARFPSVAETHQRLLTRYMQHHQEYFFRLQRYMRPLRHMKEYTVEELRESADDQREQVNAYHTYLTEFCKLVGIQELIPVLPPLPDKPYDDMGDTEGFIAERREDFSVSRGLKSSILDRASPAQREMLGLDQPDPSRAILAAQIGVDPKYLSIDRYLEQDKLESYSFARTPLAASPYESGYLNREGYLYGCIDRYHSAFAPLLCKELGLADDDEGRDHDTVLLRAGLVKFSMERFMYYPSHHEPQLASMSPEQVDAITAWADAKGRERLNYNTQMYSLTDFLAQVCPQ